MDKIDDSNAAVRTGRRWHNIYEDGIYEDAAPSAARYTTGAVKRLVEQRHPSGLGLPAELADAPSLGHVIPRQHGGGKWAAGEPTTREPTRGIVKLWRNEW
jgi:hypothetical protein